MTNSDSTNAAAPGRTTGAPPHCAERVSDARGAQATVAAFGDDHPHSVLLALDDGTLVRLPADLFEQDGDGRRRYRGAFDELAASDSIGADGVSRVIPVIEESVRIDKHVVPHGGWRITKQIELHKQVVDEPLVRVAVTVDRVPVNKMVPAGHTPEVRHEGDTMIVPILEEVLVVEKRLLLKEELHVRRTTEAFRAPQEIELRREHVSVQRIGDDGKPAAAPDALPADR